jgi:phosphoserine phosphatase
MRFVLTLIAGNPTLPIKDSTLTLVRDALASIGGRAGAPDWLDPGLACDLPFGDVPPEAATHAIRTALDKRLLAIDVVAQPMVARRKVLLLADMDSTIVTTETLDELAGEAGLKERVAAITARSMNGEMDFREALCERVAMLAGLAESTFAGILERTVLTAGARTLVRTMAANGAHTLLVSGGFRHFTVPIAARAGFDAELANSLEIRDGMLTGLLVEPILDREGKLATLRRVAAEHGLTPADALAVGDGANDLAMLGEAGLAVAFHAQPVVRKAVTARIDHANLTALLYLQGYRRENFVLD